MSAYIAIALTVFVIALPFGVIMTIIKLDFGYLGGAIIWSVISTVVSETLYLLFELLYLIWK